MLHSTLQCVDVLTRAQQQQQQFQAMHHRQAARKRRSRSPLKFAEAVHAFAQKDDVLVDVVETVVVLTLPRRHNLALTNKKGSHMFGVEK